MPNELGNRAQRRFASGITQVSPETVLAGRVARSAAASRQERPTKAELSIAGLRAADAERKQTRELRPPKPQTPCARCTRPIRGRDSICVHCQYAVRAAAKAMAAVVGGRDGYYRRTYGISASDYRSLYEQQLGLCAICCRPQEDLNAPMVVDHNHGTGEVRGLLCGLCNSGLGMFCDSNFLLLQAIAYLTERGSSSTAYEPAPRTVVDSKERRLEVKAWQLPRLADAAES